MGLHCRNNYPIESHDYDDCLDWMSYFAPLISWQLEDAKAKAAWIEYGIERENGVWCVLSLSCVGLCYIGV